MELLTIFMYVFLGFLSASALFLMLFAIILKIVMVIRIIRETRAVGENLWKNIMIEEWT